MARRRQSNPHRLVDDFNAKFAVGTPVRYFPIRDDRETFRDGKTESQAFLLGGHTACVMLTSERGAISVEHLEPLKA